MAELSLKRVAAPAVGGRTPTRTRRLTRQQLRWLLIALGPLLALLAAAYLYFSGGRYITTDDAYVRADTVSLSTDVSGLVAQVRVRDNERVKAGEPLFRLDQEPFRIALDRAEAALSMTRDKIAALQANYRQKLAAIAVAQKEAAYYEREHDRQKALAGRSFASQEALDTARERRDTARGMVAELKEELAAIAAQLGGDPSLPVERQAQYLQALAAVAQAKYELSRSVVKAPLSGYVTGVSALTPGTYLGAGTTGFYLVALHRIWIEADPKETALTHAAPGQPAVVTVDTYPGIEWRGTVETIAPASASSFSLLPAQNTSGNWVKVVQRVPVRVRVDADPGKPELRSGMSVEVTIDTGRYWRLPHFLASLFGSG
jgi:membrane fusion protein (multidrug efflux system)